MAAGLTRREFVRRAGILSLGLAVPVSLTRQRAEADARESASNRPNMIFAIADDWSWPHAGAYGDTLVKTPNFDRIAREGLLFTNAFCCAPTCTASRGGILTGQAPHRLEEGANLHSRLPAKFRTYPELLEETGYAVGATGKGWGPGTLNGTGRTRNPAGPGFGSLDEFLRTIADDRPFCYWFGSRHPHRPYRAGAGVEAGMNPQDVKVPAFLPDTPEVRSDILDYYVRVQRFDTELGEILAALESSGRASNTILIVTSDNGMPFPRAKANLYDSGTHVPLAIRWPGRIAAGRVAPDLVGSTDFAPTLLETAGLEPLSEMTGHCVLAFLTSDSRDRRNVVFLERERHAYARRNGLSYPSRAIRTERFLYIRNLRPDRWPAGDAVTLGPLGPYGDIDRSPSKDVVLLRHHDREIAPFFRLACAKRPAEELYDLGKDPWQLNDVAARQDYADEKRELRSQLCRWMRDTGDPRASRDDDRFDQYPYFAKTLGK